MGCLRVGISEYLVTQAPSVLVSYGLGSCVGIMLHDPEVKVGGLAHTLLPEFRPSLATNRPAKFVATAIEAMVREMLSAGSEPRRLVAKMCGGAHMFQSQADALGSTIGARNVMAARLTLERLGIPLAGEDVGGSFGRSIEFNLATGRVLVRFVRGHDKVREI